MSNEQNKLDNGLQLEIYALADKYSNKAAKALEKYEETGLARYYRESCKAEELEDALRMAAAAYDDRVALVHLRGELDRLASLAERCKSDPTLLGPLRDDVLMTARIHGILG